MMAEVKVRRLTIFDEKSKRVIRAAALKEKKRQKVKAEDEVCYVDSARNISVVFGAEDLIDDINENVKLDHHKLPKADVFYTMAKNLMVKQKYEDAIQCLKLAQKATKPIIRGGIAKILIVN